MLLRPARPTDASVIAEYHHRCWLVGYRGIVADDVLASLELGPRVDRWQQALDDGTVPVVVATIDDEVVGHVSVDDGVIVNVYVDPDHWGTGVGRALLAEGERLLVEDGYDVGTLWTMVGNERAIGLYESADWVTDGTIEDHPSSAGVPVREQRMRKPLGA